MRTVNFSDHNFQENFALLRATPELKPAFVQCLQSDQKFLDACIFHLSKGNDATATMITDNFLTGCLDKYGMEAAFGHLMELGTKDICGSKFVELFHLAALGNSASAVMLLEALDKNITSFSAIHALAETVASQGDIAGDLQLIGFRVRGGKANRPNPRSPGAQGEELNS